MNKTQKTYFIILTSVIIAGVLYGRYRQQSNPADVKSDVVKIGFFGPLSGDRASFGIGSQAGVKLAFAELKNASKTYNIIYEDTQGDTKTAVSAVNKLIDIDRVSALLCAGFSPECLAAAPIAQSKQVPMFVTSSQAKDLTVAGNYIFMGETPQTALGDKAAELALNLNYKTAATLTPNYNNAVIDGTKGFADNFAAKGGKVVDQETIRPNETDFRTYLTKTNAAHPDAIYLSTLSNETAIILRQKTELGLKAQFINNGAIEDPATLAAAGPAAEGLLLVSFNAEIPKSFSDEFQNAFGYAAPRWSMEGYEAGRILIQALGDAKSTAGSDVRDALAAIKEFRGVSQTLRFDGHGDIQRQVYAKQIKDGKIQPYQNQ